MMPSWLFLASITFAGVDFQPPGAGEPQPTFMPDYSGEFDSPPVTHWHAELPGGRVNSATHTERGRPVIVGDSIFVGSAAGQGLYELSRKDGRVIREYSADSSVESAAVVTNDKIYFSDTAGTTWCYSRDGSLAWSRKGTAPVLVEPSLSDKHVFITTVEDEAVAIDRVTGRTSWTYSQPRDLMRESELKLYGAPAAVIRGESVIFGFSDGTVAALSTQKGAVVWAKRIGEGRYPDIVATPQVAGPDLIVSGYYQPVLAFDLETRNVLWRLDHGAASAALVEQQDNQVSVYHPGRDGVLRKISGSTGAIEWSWDSATNGALSQPQRLPAGILVTSSEGSVYLIDPESGEEIWRYHEPVLLSGVTAQPSVDGRQLVFVTNAGKIYSMLSVR